jgi:hypothetical protein
VNEPLGAFVVRIPSKRLTPFWRMTTFQRLPTRFWSTSNSVWMPPSSCFAFSFQSAEPLQEPRLMTSVLPFAGALAAPSRAASAATVDHNAEDDCLDHGVSPFEVEPQRRYAVAFKARAYSR